MDESMSAGGMSAQGTETAASAASAADAPMMESTEPAEPIGQAAELSDQDAEPVEPIGQAAELSDQDAEPVDDFESRVRESDIYKALEQQARVHEAENAAFRLEREKNQILRAVEQRMAEDLKAIQQIDPTVESLESLSGYYELAERGITGADAYHILKGRNDAEYREVVVMERVQRRMAEDLRAIQQIDPTVESLESLPGYYELAERGITGADAYHVLEGQKAVNARMMPSSTGSIQTGGRDESDFDGEQLEKLTRTDLKNDRIYKRALRSLSKLYFD